MASGRAIGDTWLILHSSTFWSQHFTDYGHVFTFVAATLGVETRERARKWL